MGIDGYRNLETLTKKGKIGKMQRQKTAATKTGNAGKKTKRECNSTSFALLEVC